MRTDPAVHRARFRRLHEGGCFVMPNPWDVGSARMLQHLGFPALATTSAGLAFSRGSPDNAVPRAVVLEHARTIAQAVDVPVNADFESGFAADADCLYAPGLRTGEEVAAVVRAVAPRPVNVLAGAPGFSVAQLRDLGVRRISVGAALARTAWGAFLAAAEEIATAGTFESFGGAAPFARLNGFFGEDVRRRP